MVIDRRNDANAETGEFEMIYKQMIPKTPAYMGLNLALKGQRLTLPKSMAAKEKSIISPLKSLQTTFSHASSGRSAMPSGAPIILDLIESLNLKNKMDKENSSLQKRIQSTMVYKKPNFANVLQKSTLNIVNRQQQQYYVNKNIRNYLNQIEVDNKAKRNASCVPRICMRTEEFLNSDGTIKKKPITCVGSKFSDDLNKLTYDEYFRKSSSTSSLNRLQKPPISIQNQTDYNNNKLSKSCTNSKNRTNNNTKKLSRPSSANVLSRKTLSKYSGHANTGNNANPSHFYAVGLSLSAWKSKYKNIFKNNLQTQSSASNLRIPKPLSSSGTRKLQEQYNNLLSARNVSGNGNLQNLTKNSMKKVQTK